MEGLIHIREMYLLCSDKHSSSFSFAFGTYTGKTKLIQSSNQYSEKGACTDQTVNEFNRHPSNGY